MTGIYCIRNLIDGRFYIGSAARDITKRWKDHRKTLRADEHANFRLQAAWRFYGEDNFRFAVVEECSAEQCIAREQHFIDIFDPEYNICRIAGSSLGLRRTEATRARISAVTAGRKLSPEWRKKIGDALRGRHVSPEARATLLGNQRRRGIPHSAEIKAKLRTAITGIKRSPETRLKMSAAQKRRFSSTSTLNS